MQKQSKPTTNQNQNKQTNKSNGYSSFFSIKLMVTKHWFLSNYKVENSPPSSGNVHILCLQFRCHKECELYILLQAWRVHCMHAPNRAFILRHCISDLPLTLLSLHLVNSNTQQTPQSLLNHLN